MSAQTHRSAASAAFTLGALLFSLLHLVAPVAAARNHDLPIPADPYSDPRHDPLNPLRYIASNVLTAIAFSLMLIVAVLQTVWIFRRGAKWMMAMTIGAYCFALGLGCRFGLHSDPRGKAVYIVEYLFVVLSPCAFIAADYVLLGRLARYLQAERHLLIPARRITLVFILSDVTTFLIQAGGGSATISAKDTAAIQKGEHIFLVGLALQLLSFLIFTVTFLLFLSRLRKHDPATWTKDAHKPWYADWRALAGALFVSCIGILIRSVYRTIEISQGFGGHLATTEAFFYALDTLPLWVAVAVYVPFWPGRFIPLFVPAGAEQDRERASTDTVADPRESVVVQEEAEKEKEGMTPRLGA